MDRNMKNILFIITALLFNACSSTPEGTVENMHDALKDGDFLKFSRNTNDPITRIFSVEALATCSVDKKSYKDGDFSLLDDCFIEKYSDLNIKNIKIINLSQDKARAIVTTTQNSEEETHKYILIKRDDNWKVIYSEK